MKLKIKLQNNSNNELNIYESPCSIPYVINRELAMAGRNVGLLLTDYVWQQIPEEVKIKIENLSNKLKVFGGEEISIDSAKLTITDVTAYSFELRLRDIAEKHEKITIEEIYENFDKEKYIHLIASEILFPSASLEMYIQTVGDIYIEFDVRDILEEDHFIASKKLYKKIKEIRRITTLKEYFRI